VLDFERHHGTSSSRSAAGRPSGHVSVRYRNNEAVLVKEMPVIIAAIVHRHFFIAYTSRIPNSFSPFAAMNASMMIFMPPSLTKPCLTSFSCRFSQQTRGMATEKQSKWKMASK